MEDDIGDSQQPENIHQIEITRAMVDAGIRALRESGRFEHPGLIDSVLVTEVLREALAAR